MSGDHARNYFLRPSRQTKPALITQTLTRAVPGQSSGMHRLGRSAGVVTEATTDTITLPSLDSLLLTLPTLDPRDIPPQCFAQSDRRLVDADPVDRRPQFQGVPTRAAAEALVPPQPQVHRERPAPRARGAVDRTGATQGVARDARRMKPRQPQHVGHRDLLSQ